MNKNIFILILVCIGFLSKLYAGEVIWDNSWEMSENGKDWKRVELPNNLYLELEDLNSEEIYLRTSFFLENSKPPQHPLAMRLGIILDRDRFYLNDRLINHTGLWDSTKPQGYDKVRIYEIPTEILKLESGNKILLHIKKYFPEEIGLAQDRIEINSSSIIWKDFYYEEMTNLGFLVFYIAVSLYFLFLYISRRKEIEYLYFSLFTLNLIFYQFQRTQSKFLLPLEFWELKYIEYLLLPSLFPLMAHFVRSFLGYAYTRTHKILDTLTIISLLFIFTETDIIDLDTWNRYFIQPTWGLYAINSFVLIIYKIKQKDFDAKLLMLGFIAIIASGLLDILSSRLVWNLPRLSGYSFMANVIFQALLLANRFVRLNKKVEDLNQNLEEKVESRTRELERSLIDMQSLKKSQDGDYFLTSLLLRPLHLCTQKSNNLEINIITKQKKKFQFKERDYEIGGDLSMVHEMELKGEDYLFFMNSDSMGKSIQGAGGSLVLGVLIKTILSRQQKTINRDRYPERWLKDCFLDLQNAFETFEGSMFASLILGLVHKRSGVIFYFNAEHPKIVLYNTNTAIYLDNKDNSIRKIGIPGNEINFQVSCYKMNSNDTIILGTDGRDDIDIGINENKVINEDENLFLKIVGLCDGNLEKIIDTIHKFGRVTDDISLLSIRLPMKVHNPIANKRNILPLLKETKKLVKKNEIDFAIQAMEKAYLLDPSNPMILEIIGRLYFKLGSFEIAYTYFQKTLKLDPSNTNSIYYSAKSLNKFGKYLEAIDSLERLKIRNCDNPSIQRLFQQITRKSSSPKQILEISNNWKAA